MALELHFHSSGSGTAPKIFRVVEFAPSFFGAAPTNVSTGSTSLPRPILWAPRSYIIGQPLTPIGSIVSIPANYGQIWPMQGDFGECGRDRQVLKQFRPILREHRHRWGELGVPTSARNHSIPPSPPRSQTSTLLYADRSCHVWL